MSFITHNTQKGEVIMKVIMIIAVALMSITATVNAGDKDWARAGKVQAVLNGLRIITNDKVDPIGTVNDGIRGNKRSTGVKQYPTSYTKDKQSWSSRDNNRNDRYEYGHGYERQQAEQKPAGPQFETVTTRELVAEEKEIDKDGNIVVTKIYKEVTIIKEVKR
jgi:hypothetical protein